MEREGMGGERERERGSNSGRRRTRPTDRSVSIEKAYIRKKRCRYNLLILAVWMQLLEGKRGLILKSCARTRQTHMKCFNLCPRPFPPSHLPAGAGFVRERIKPKSNKSLYGLCGGTAICTKLLHLRAQKNRQQPSHLHVINPDSPLAAFLPFTTHCLKLKRGGGGKGQRGRH